MSIICREELKRLRLNMLNSLYQCKTGHLGGSFSCLEFLALVYTKFPQNLQLVMSKGHASLALYTVIDWVRKSDNPIMKHYGKESDGEFHGHISKKADASIALSCGSLGHGFPFALGLAVANMYKKSDRWVICLLGDGEIQEGTTWETILLLSKFKSQLKLLIAIDSNKSQQSFDNKQTEMISMLANKAGINIEACEGNNIAKLDKVFDKIIASQDSTILILKSTKGYGIPSIHGKEKWHAGKINDQLELNSMIDELSNFAEG